MSHCKGLALLAMAMISGISNAVGASYPAEFSFDALVNTMDHHPVQNLNELLPLIPLDIRSRYVVIYRSRSLQGADFQKPRIVMFSSDAKFVATFNGSPTQKGYNNLEVIQFDDVKKAFEFREIEFTRDAKPKISEANPAKCLQCHQGAHRLDIDPRPNWEPYDIWPGVYGSDGGNLQKTSNFVDLALQMQTIKNTEVVEIMNLQSQEASYAKAFAEAYLSDLRYHYLGPPSFNFGLMSNSSAISGDTNTPTYLTEAFGRLNYQRVARLLRALPSYENSKYIIANALACGRYDKFDIFDFPEKLRRYYPEKWTQKSAYYEQNIGQIIGTFVNPLGVNTEDWSMDFQTQGKLAFSDRFGTPGLPPLEFLAQLALQDDDLRRLVTFGSEEYRTMSDYHSIQLSADKTDVFCQVTTEEGTRRLDQYILDIQGAHEAHRVAPPLLNKCIACHSGSDRPGPLIYFDRPELLKKQLVQPGYPHGRLIDEIEFRLGPQATQSEKMPLGGHADSTQMDQLMQYLDNQM